MFRTQCLTEIPLAMTLKRYFKLKYSFRKKIKPFFTNWIYKNHRTLVHISDGIPEQFERIFFKKWAVVL